MMTDATLPTVDPVPVAVGKRAAQGSGLMVIARLLTRLFDLGTMLALTRLLVPADFGLVAVAMTLINVADAALELPINQALLRLPEVHQSHYDTAFTTALLRGALLFLFFVVAAHPFAIIYDDPRLTALILVLGLAPIFNGLTSPRMAEFQKRLSFWRDFIIEIVGKLIAFATCITVALLTNSYWAIAVGTTVYTVATALYSYVLVPYRPRLSMSEFHAFRGFFGWASAAQLIGALNWQFERLLLGKFEPIARLGLFTTASDLSSIPFNGVFGPMLRPLLAAFSHLQDDRSRLAASYQRASSAIVSIGLPLLVGEAMVATPLVFVVLGPRWSNAAPFVYWLSLSLTPSLFTFPLVSLLMAVGQTRTFFTRNLVEIVIKAPLAVVGVLSFGFFGVIIARFVSEIVVSLGCIWLIRHLLGLTILQQISVSWRPLLATGAMAAIVHIIQGLMPDPATGLADAILTLATIVPAGIVVYVAVLLSAWLVAGCPDGLERMGLHAVKVVLIRLRVLQRPTVDKSI